VFYIDAYHGPPQYTETYPKSYPQTYPADPYPQAFKVQFSAAQPYATQGVIINPAVQDPLSYPTQSYQSPPSAAVQVCIVAK